MTIVVAGIVLDVVGGSVVSVAMTDTAFAAGFAGAAIAPTIPTPSNAARTTPNPMAI
jgi:hypothetical protein